MGYDKVKEEEEEEEQEAGPGYVDPLATTPIHSRLESLCDDEGRATRPFPARAVYVRE